MYFNNDITHHQKRTAGGVGNPFAPTLSSSSSSWHPIHMTASEDLWELPTLPSRNASTSMDEQDILLVDDDHVLHHDEMIPFPPPTAASTTTGSSLLPVPASPIRMIGGGGQATTPSRTQNNEQQQRKKRRTLEDASNTAPVMNPRRSMF